MLYDDFLDLKAIVLRLTEEVNAMKAAQQRKPMVFHAPFYLQDGDKTPFCAVCFEKDGMAIHLERNGGDAWLCNVCKNGFWDSEA